MPGRTHWLLATLVTLMTSVAAGSVDAQDVPPPVPPSSASCSVVDLTLDGAGERSTEEGADFVPEWQPQLVAASACLAMPGAERACLEVQGQYDDHVFEPAVARAMGSQRAAQLHRARGRSEAVITALADLGVSYDRLRQRPPPTEPSYRGVRIQVIPECMPLPPEARMPDWASSPETLAHSLEAAGLTAHLEPAAAPPAPPEPRPAFGPLSIDGALRLDFVMSRADDGFGFGVRTAIGYGERRLYVRALVGIGTADRLAQRAQIEWGVSGGFRPLRWLRVGGVFTQRFGTYRAFDPWLEQTLQLGVEAEQRVVQLERVSLWIGETLSPLGVRVQRATIESGQIIDSHDRLDYAFAAMLTVTVRGHVAAGRDLPGAAPPSRPR